MSDSYTRSVSVEFANLPRTRRQAKLLAALTGRWPEPTVTRMRASELIDAASTKQAARGHYGTRQPTGRISSTYGGQNGNHYSAPAAQPFDPSEMSAMIAQSVATAIVAALPAIIAAVQPAPVLTPVTKPASKPRANGKHAPVAAN